MNQTINYGAYERIPESDFDGHNDGHYIGKTPNQKFPWRNVLMFATLLTVLAVTTMSITSKSSSASSEDLLSSQSMTRTYFVPCAKVCVDSCITYTVRAVFDNVHLLS